MGKILIFNAETTRVEENYNRQTRELIAQKEADKLAKAAAPRMAEYSPGYIYYFPGGFIELTAKIIADFYRLPLQILPGCDDLTDTELAEYDSLNIEKGLNGRLLERLRIIIDNSLDKVIELHKKDSIVIVASKHLCVIMVLYMLHMNNSHYGQIEQSDGAMNLFEVRSGVPSALYINDTCHMRDLV